MQTTRTYRVGGGLDQVSATLDVPLGSVRSSMNYEPVEEGYRSCDGYERYDGQPAPSEAAYWVMPYSLGNSELLAGQIVVGSTSAATGVLLVASQVESGTFVAGNSAGKLVLTRVTGTFVANELLAVNGTVRARAVTTAVRSGSDTVAQDELYLELAQSSQRTRILKVPGQGPVRGVAELDGTLYAWRDNVPGTAAGIYKETPTGWEPVPAISWRLSFTLGIVRIEEGQTITGATSGRTALVHRVVKNKGDWGSTASGYLVLSSPTGAFVGEAIRVGATPVATISGDAALVVLPPGGNYRFRRHNFYGGTTTRCVYGVNGVGKGFEFDGTHLVPIETGVEDDRPIRVCEQNNHLVLAYRGGKLRTSISGEPLIHDGAQGALDQGVGADVTDLLSVANSTAIFCADRISVLTGSDIETFDLETVGGEDDVGADAYTAQRMGRGVYLDSRGLRFLSTAADYGNFRYGTISDRAFPLFKAKRKAQIAPAISFVSRSKGHYRLVWEDGTGVSVFNRGRFWETMAFDLGDMRPVSVVVSERADGTEGIFVGAEDGYVYRLDSGTSHDGERINAFLLFPFNHVGSHMQEKRFCGVNVEISSGSRTEIGVLCQYGFGESESSPESGSVQFFAGADNGFIVTGGGGQWDIASWDEFYWSSPLEGEASAEARGKGRNISILVSSRRGATEQPHVIKSYTVIYIPLGRVGQRVRGEN